MVKNTISAAEYRKKKNNELISDLKKLREELQKIRFNKQSGTAVSKLSKIKSLRKQIARVLTIIRENTKNEVISKLLTKEKKEVKDDKEETITTTIKNLKMKHIPLDLRPKKTRAMRRRLTKFENKLVTLKQLKRKLNFPKRKFAVPVA
jgi:large subunit ribosomal protein L35e